MKILITGMNGQVGGEVFRLFGNKSYCNILATRRTLAFDHDKRVLCLDLSDLKQLDKVIMEFRPDVVINAAAYTQVDAAEDDVENAHKINKEVPSRIAQLLSSYEGFLIHFSTDYVFDGSGCSPRSEADPVNPINEYGRSKLAGEEAVRNSGCDYIILRTSWVFSYLGHNFMNTMLKMGMEREELKIVDDQIGAPTSAGELCRAVDEVINVWRSRRGVWPKDLNGIYNLVCDGEVSWYGFAQEIFRLARQFEFGLKVKNIAAIKSHEFNTRALRPCNSRLDTTKFVKTFLFEPLTWQDALEVEFGKLKNSK